jgi:hypothetical protein
MIVFKESSLSSHVGLRIVNNFVRPLNLGKDYFRDGEHYLDYESFEVNIAKISSQHCDERRFRNLLIHGKRWDI